MYHKITIVGRLGRDPEMRYAPSGDAVTSFSVAVNDNYKKDDQKVERTIWFRVTVWGKFAEICNQYLQKGRLILVEGQLIFDPKTGGPKLFERKDKSVGAAFEIRAEEIRFLSSNGTHQEVPEDTNAIDTSEDAPF